MQILDRIEDQINATGLPLVGISLAAVPCPDTPVILTLHWHGFIKQKLVDLDEAEPMSFTSVPSSSLQLNERWRDLLALDCAAMDAGWALGAWDVARAERPGCRRPGADPTEALECLQACPMRRTGRIWLNWPPRAVTCSGCSARCAVASGVRWPTTPPCPRRGGGHCPVRMRRSFRPVPASAKPSIALVFPVIASCR